VKAGYFSLAYYCLELDKNDDHFHSKNLDYYWGVTLIKITIFVRFVAHAYGNQQQEQLEIKCWILLLSQPSTATTTFL
jgi:hypothetical protein